MIKCDICYSALRMDEDKAGATCTGCGMKYSIEQVRQMASGNTKQKNVEVKVKEKTEETEVVEPVWKEVPAEKESVEKDEPIEMTEWTEVTTDTEIIQTGAGNTEVTNTKKKANLIPYILGLIGVLFTAMGGFFPMLIGDIIVIIAIIMFIQDVRKRK